MAKRSNPVIADGEMDENEGNAPVATDLREALILAGIDELEAHGPQGFSLRRVATACGVSCAAPYKHFESKEDFIGAILSYIYEKWSLLEEHICTLFPTPGAERLTELCLAGVRFWLGNPHFHAIHRMTGQGDMGKMGLGARAEEELRLLCEREERDYVRLSYVLRSLVHGAIVMLEDGTLSGEAGTFRMLRRVVDETLAK